MKEINYIRNVKYSKIKVNKINQKAITTNYVKLT